MGGVRARGGGTGWRGAPVRLVAGTGAVLALLLPSGCASDVDESAEQVFDVVSGVVVDAPQGSPRGDVDVELLVHPSAMGSSGNEGRAVSAGRVTADAQGRFVLAAAVEELTPFASPDGRVQVEVRVADQPDGGTRTTVLLRKDGATGVTSVQETTDVTVAAQ